MKAATIILAVVGLFLTLYIGYFFSRGQGPASDRAMPTPGRSESTPLPTEVVLTKPLPVLPALPGLPGLPMSDRDLEKGQDPGGAKAASEMQRQAVDPGPVEFFEHGRSSDLYPGLRWQVPLGLTSNDLVLGHDQASSVMIPAGLQATLFEDEDGQGHRVQLGPGFYNLASYGFDEIVSSVRVSLVGQDDLAWKGPVDGVELYEHRESHEGDRGVSWKLVLPRKRANYLFVSGPDTFVNDAVSAAWIPPGLVLSLFDQHDGFGAAIVLGPGYHELDFVDFNDKTSSARIRRSP